MYGLHTGIDVNNKILLLIILQLQLWKTSLTTLWQVVETVMQGRYYTVAVVKIIKKVE